MKKWSLLILIITAFSVNANGAERLYLDAYSTYLGEELDYELYGFRSNDDAKRAIERVMEYAGLEPTRITILAANVDNAAAGIRGTERLILYRPEFILEIEETTNSEWAALSIIAHEVGHHLQGHTLLPGGSKPEEELEADQFSGHLLCRMGTPLYDAQIVMKLMGSDTGSATHPPKSARLVAIANGWEAAQDQHNQSSISNASPEIVARQFTEALLYDDFQQAWLFIHPKIRDDIEKDDHRRGKIEEGFAFIQAIFQELTKKRNISELFEDVSVAISGDSATVTVVAIGATGEEWTNKFPLKRSGKQWFIWLTDY